MKFYLTKNKAGIYPLTESDREALNMIEYGESFECKRVNQRNPLFHRKFFALLQLAWDNLPEQFESYFPRQQKVPDEFRYEVIKRAGYFEKYTNLKGVVEYKAKSIAFDRMKEEEFQALYSAVIDVIIKYFIPDLDRDILEHEIMNFL